MSGEYKITVPSGYRLTPLEELALKGEFVEAVNEVIDFMVEHATDARWDFIHRAMDIMESGYKNDG